MNESNPPPFSGTAAQPLAPKPSAGPPVYLRRLLLSMVLAVAVFDLCFWGITTWGFSVAVFFPVLAALILVNREPFRWRRSTVLMLALFAGAALAAVIETSITNTFVLLALIVALAGETFFNEVDSPWGRWFSQLIALVWAPGRVFWLGGTILESVFRGGVGWTGTLIGGCLLALPALILALVFGSLLASGNAVFGSWASDCFNWLWKELALFLDPARIALWVFIGFLVLPFLRPAQVAAPWWSWIERLPRLPEMLPARAALFSSSLILIVLNLLFLVANSADALFLWSGRPLPSDVPYKSYVHEGVNSLIVTVILTAIVLTVIFQQALSVAQRRELKALAFFWIAQNLFLLLSVALRIKYYIEAFEMTVLRLGVIIFLLLVAVGFVLLSIKIVKDKSLSWLVGGCALAVFATFYVTQFLDLAGWSSNYNVARFEQDHAKKPDIWYLHYYGPAAWPALRRAREIDPTIPMFNTDPSQGEVNTQTIHLAEFDFQHWREFSLRAWMNRWALDDKK